MVKKFHFFDIDALKNFHKRIFFSIIVDLRQSLVTISKRKINGKITF